MKQLLIFIKGTVLRDGSDLYGGTNHLSLNSDNTQLQSSQRVTHINSY